MVASRRQPRRLPAALARASFRSLLLVLLLLCARSTSGRSSKPLLRIGIIGGGISGASSAHWLRASLGAQFDLRLTCFERESSVGGRIGDIHLDGPSERWENGASILHASNLYMHYFARTLNLTVEDHPTRKLDKAVAIWNGREFVLRLSGSTLWDAYALVRRYGLDFFRLRSAIGGVAEAFARIYAHQDRGLVFDGPEDLLAAIGLKHLTQQTLADWLAPRLSPEATILDELAAASTRVNYGQGVGIHAMAGAVGLIPLTDSNLWAVAEGNARVVEGLMAREGVSVRRGHTVTRVERRRRQLEDGPSEGYTLSGTVSGGERNFTSGRFDVVILAAPLESSGIDFRLPIRSSTRAPHSQQEAEEEFRPQPPAKVRAFQVTHTTWVRGRLRPEVFRTNRAKEGITRNELDPLDLQQLSAGVPDSLPGTILTTDDPTLDFTSITAYSSIPAARPTTADAAEAGAARMPEPESEPVEDLRTYKVFSRHRFGDELVGRYFARVDRNQVRRTAWRAYPKYRTPPPEEFLPSFNLFAAGGGAGSASAADPREDEEIYYPLALEHSASCMEVQVVAARNVAMQVARKWRERKRTGRLAGWDDSADREEEEHRHEEL